MVVIKGTAKYPYELHKEWMVRPEYTVCPASKDKGKEQIQYYKGMIQFDHGREKACFVCFKDRVYGRKVYKCGLEVTNEKIMKPIFGHYNDALNMFIIGYEIFRFIGSCYEVPEKEECDWDSDDIEANCCILKFMKLPRQSMDRLKPELRKECKGLMLGVRAMILHSFSSTWLASRSAYVWSVRRKEFKLLFVDKVLDSGVDSRKEFLPFRKSLEIFLQEEEEKQEEEEERQEEEEDNGPQPWKARGNFLDFLTNWGVGFDIRLEVASRHPFLEDTPEEILLLFPKVWHAKNSATSQWFKGNPYSLKQALSSADFEKRFVPWNKNSAKWNQKLKDVYQRGQDFQINSGQRTSKPYDPNDVGDLFRFLRNVQQHHCEGANPINMVELYNEVVTWFPEILDLTYLAANL